MEFENKNLVVIEGKNQVQVNELKELTSKFFDEEYEKKDNSEKLKERYAKIYPYALLNKNKIYLNKNIEIVRGKLKKSEDAFIDESLFIDTDENFFVSLCKINALKIFEKKESNILTSKINKSNMTGNYVSVNFFAEEILEKNLEDKEKGVEEK